MTDAELKLMTDAAESAYFGTRNWKAAYSAANLCAREKIGKVPSRSDILAALANVDRGNIDANLSWGDPK